MAKKIEWTETSLRDRVNIYRYWLERNKSDSNSEKLELAFWRGGNANCPIPEAGRETDFPRLRIKVIKHFKIYYLNHEEVIHHYPWNGQGKVSYVSVGNHFIWIDETKINSNYPF